ncbi:MAG: lipoyl(octanoyl) transferase LipB [Bacteroidales bacterium]|nr:lipoyl(octanoyl) transferase LipB [Bacteroidales bacterium]MBN2698946.1 lipoyl(octanoyl) transferase LipB [Bacteroidales bacterium]
MNNHLNVEIEFVDLGLIDYKEAWDYQERLFNRIIEDKQAGGNPAGGERLPNQLIFCEHPHVYTLGKSGNENNLLIHKEFLKEIRATYYKTNRGGDITYHGPGQIVGYPVIDLEDFGLGLRRYIELLEQAIIELLGHFGIASSLMDSATGVWLDADHPVKARKICAIGVRSSRFVTMHGFALNVNTDLDYFTYINPCGLDRRGVTSMEKELGTKQDFERVKEDLRVILLRRLRAAQGQ